MWNKYRCLDLLRQHQDPAVQLALTSKLAGCGDIGQHPCPDQDEPVWGVRFCQVQVSLGGGGGGMGGGPSSAQKSSSDTW